MGAPVVLAVEDSDGDFYLLELAFKECSGPIEVRRTSNGEAAVAFLLLSACLDKLRPALVLLDVNMPGKNGFDVLQLIKSHKAISDIPVVMFTSSADAHDRQRALSLGAQGYITKPLDLDQMMKVVNDICSDYLLK